MEVRVARTIWSLFRAYLAYIEPRGGKGKYGGNQSCRALPLKGVQLFLCVRYSLNPVK